MPWDAVRAWRDSLRDAEVAPEVGLSQQGFRQALTDGLDALHDAALDEAAARPGAPYDTATVVTASTVFTAPIEWCAVLLGRGTEVWLKWSRRRAGIGPHLVASARACGLPLHGGEERSLVSHGELVVVMGSDATVAQIRGDLRPDQTLAAHGHGVSVAWVTGDRWDGLARDLAMHDGRGCLSPVLVFTSRPLDEAVGALGTAMAAAQARWPAGALTLPEAAARRERGALARVLGRVAAGAEWEVHGLPVSHVTPRVIPRCPLVVSVRSLDAALAVMRPYRGSLSSVGTDDGASAGAWSALGASRVCALGEMQRPPLVRRQDGVDWIGQTLRSEG